PTLALAGEIGRAVRHGRRVCVGVSAEGVTAVVRDVEPLVAVRRPGVRGPDAGHQMTGGRTGRGPQPEGPVDVDPRAVAVSHLRRADEVVKGASIDVARLQTHDRR